MLRALATHIGERSGLPISVTGPDDVSSRLHVSADNPESGEHVGGFNLDYLPPGMGKPTRDSRHAPMHYFGVNADVEVDPDWQRQGIASDMWDALEHHIAGNFPGESIIDHGGFSPEGSQWWNSYAAGFPDSPNYPQIHYF